MLGTDLTQRCGNIDSATFKPGSLTADDLFAFADAVTQAWLHAHSERVFGFPSLVRFSWQGAVRLMDERCCKVQFPCDSDEVPGQQALAYGAAPPKASSGAGRHSYMRARKLQRMQAF